jgi:hypothetical protein
LVCIQDVPLRRRLKEKNVLGDGLQESRGDELHCKDVLRKSQLAVGSRKMPREKLSGTRCISYRKLLWKLHPNLPMESTICSVPA